MSNRKADSLIPRQAFEAAQNGALVLDIREKAFTGYKRFDVPEVLFCPMSKLEEKWGSIPSGRQLILADTSGLHVRHASEILFNHGFSEVSVLAGGVVEWERDGFPLCEDLSERLTGSCTCMLRPRDKK